MTEAQHAAFRLSCALPRRFVRAKPRPDATRIHTADQRERAEWLRREGLKIARIAQVMRVPRSTVGRWVKGMPR